MRSLLYRLATEQDGAQVIEYALIIALSALVTNGGSFSTFIGRVTNCLGGNTCT